MMIHITNTATLQIILPILLYNKVHSNMDGNLSNTDRTCTSHNKIN